MKIGPQICRHVSYANMLGGLHWVRGGAPAAKRFSCILEAPDGLSWNLLG